MKTTTTSTKLTVILVVVVIALMSHENMVNGIFPYRKIPDVRFEKGVLYGYFMAQNAGKGGPPPKGLKGPIYLA